MCRTVRRRTYGSLGELGRDLRLLARSLARRYAARDPVPIPAAFRERLMLVVTGVNQCRYCAAFHGRLAPRAGVSPREAHDLLAGLLEESPADQRPALVHARSWAENGARAHPVLRADLERAYGNGGAAAIEALLYSIRIGNLLGNTWDHLLCRISGGRFGCDANGTWDGCTPERGQP